MFLLQKIKVLYKLYLVLVSLIYYLYNETISVFLATVVVCLHVLKCFRNKACIRGIHTNSYPFRNQSMEQNIAFVINLFVCVCVCVCLCVHDFYVYHCAFIYI